MPMDLPPQALPAHEVQMVRKIGGENRALFFRICSFLSAFSWPTKLDGAFAMNNALARLLVFSISTLHIPLAKADIFKCVDPDGHATYGKERTDGCTPIVRIPVESKKYTEGIKALEDEARKYRKSVKVGDYTPLGMITEIRLPIVRIQTRTVERWYNINEVVPFDFDHRKQKLESERWDRSEEK